MSKRKIIEIYITENEEENSISFDIERTENSKIAGSTMKMLLYMLSSYKNDEDKLEVEYEQSR